MLQTQKPFLGHHPPNFTPISISSVRGAKHLVIFLVWRITLSNYKDGILALWLSDILCNSRSASAVCGCQPPWPFLLQCFILTLWKRFLPLALLEMPSRHNSVLSLVADNMAHLWCSRNVREGIWNNGIFLHEGTFVSLDHTWESLQSLWWCINVTLQKKKKIRAPI